MQYIIKDLDDRELGRANDARSAWALIEAEWSDTVAVGLDGTRARGWVMLATLLETVGEAVIVRYNRQVGVCISIRGGGWRQPRRSRKIDLCFPTLFHLAR